MSEEKYMVSQVVTYSDGTKTTVTYKQNGSQEEIESAVAEAVKHERAEEEITN